jgi:hypothetical protein
MARRRPSPFLSPNVEARESGVAADPNAPTGEWVVHRGTVWKASHPVVIQHPELFCELGDGQTVEPYFPERVT